MTTYPDTFCQFARRVLPSSMTDDAHLRFQRLARRHDLRSEAPLQFDKPGEQLVFLGSGATKLVAHASQSRDQIVAFHFGGDMFMVPSADNYSYSLTALQPSRLLSFPSAPFLELAGGEAAVMRHMFENANLSLRRCREKAIALGKKSAAERVAVFLIAMAERIGIECESGAISLNLPMSRRDIAESLGLTIETVSRQLTCLRELGAIDTTGRAGVTLIELDALRQRAGYLVDAA